MWSHELHICLNALNRGLWHYYRWYKEFNVESNVWSLIQIPKIDREYLSWNERNKEMELDPLVKKFLILLQEEIKVLRIKEELERKHHVVVELSDIIYRLKFKIKWVKIYDIRKRGWHRIAANIYYSNNEIKIYSPDYSLCDESDYICSLLKYEWETPEPSQFIFR